MFDAKSISVSVMVNELRVLFPVFVMVNLYFMTSPRLFVPLPSTSITSCSFIKSIDETVGIFVTVGSLAAPVVGSSLVSDTLLLSPGLLAITYKLLETAPEFAAPCPITYVAV